MIIIITNKEYYDGTSVQFALRLSRCGQYVELHTSVCLCLFRYAADFIVMAEGRNKTHFAPLCCQDMDSNVLFVQCFSLFIHIHVTCLFIQFSVSRFRLELI